MYWLVHCYYSVFFSDVVKLCRNFNGGVQGSKDSHVPAYFYLFVTGYGKENTMKNEIDRFTIDRTLSINITGFGKIRRHIRKYTASNCEYPLKSVMMSTIRSMFKVTVEDDMYTVKVHWPTIDDHFGFVNQEYESEWFVFRKFIDAEMTSQKYIHFYTEKLIDEFYDDVDAFVDEVDGTFIYDQLTSQGCFSFVYDEKISLRVRIKARAMIIEREREVLKTKSVPMPSKWLMRVARGQSRQSQMQALS